MIVRQFAGFTALILSVVLQSLEISVTRADDQLSAKNSNRAVTSDTSPLFPPRPPAEMRKSVSNALRATATAKDAAERDPAIRQLMLILLELEQDQKLPHDERVELHTQVRSRLLTIEKNLRAELARRNQGTKITAANNAAASAKPLIARRLVPSGNSPEQVVGSPAGVLQAQLPTEVPPQDGLAQLAGRIAPALAQQGNAPPAGGIAVPPAPAIIGRAPAGQAAFDYGQDLVDLIHAVVSPRTWDVNGGPGAVVYYRNLRALVVRAPAEVHSEIGDILGQLRK